MSSEDPIPDIAPDEQHQEKTNSLVSNPNQALLYIGIALPLILVYLIAWSSLNFMIIRRIPVLYQNSGFLLFLWIIPILGLISSILFPSLGGTIGWIIATSVLAGLPILLSFPFVLFFGVD